MGSPDVFRPGFSSIWVTVHVAYCCHDQPMTRTSKLIAAAGLVLTIAACGGKPAAAPKAAPFTAQGYVKLVVGQLLNVDDVQCTGLGDAGYSDIQAGTQVVVYDATGKTVALGQLAMGQMVGTRTADAECDMAFTVAGVPSGVGPYSVEVAHRGKIVFTQAQASDVELSLGS